MYYNIRMEKIKEPSVANSFYSGDINILKNQLDEFAANNKNEYVYDTRAVIVPHAGLVFSGQLAYEGINQLDKEIKNIFIFAPAHKVGFEGISLSSFDKWQTPLGNIDINQEINQVLINKFGAKIFDEAHTEEHSIEIQLPIIQYIFKDVKIIPVLIGRENPQKITEIISEYYNNKDFGFIISSDLSHFLTDEKACKTDNQTAQMIETGEIQGFRYNQACGAIGIYGLTEFANNNNFSLIRIDMRNSSAVNGDKNRVVGYGCWFLYEGNKNNFIKTYYSDYVLKLCKDVISSSFDKNTVYTDHLPIFDELGACFVTLKRNKQLRGCIGSIVAYQPLIDDLIKHAQDAAFHDPRFLPLEKSELEDLTLDVSLLSVPKQMTFTNEQDLLNKIVPYKDGIIIKDGNKQAVYLPSVWEELPDKELFLKSLKRKAGMPPDHFSKTFQVFRFETEYLCS